MAESTQYLIFNINLAVDHIGGASPATSWERFYIRLRALPTAQTTFWFAGGTIEASTGIVLAITPSGQIAVFQSSNIGVLTLLGTTVALTLDAWVKLDGLVTFGTGAGFRLWLNGVQVLTITVPPTQGMAAVGRLHAGSTMGSSAAHDLALDIVDDTRVRKGALPRTGAGRRYSQQ